VALSFVLIKLLRSGEFGVKNGPSNWAGVLEPQLGVRVAWASDFRLVKTAAEPKLK
jgi:hypothetical protein